MKNKANLTCDLCGLKLVEFDFTLFGGNKSRVLNSWYAIKGHKAVFDSEEEDHFCISCYSEILAAAAKLKTEKQDDVNE